MKSGAILLVDDEPAVRLGYSRFFFRAGFDIDTVATLAEARQRVALQRWAVIILDVNLPDGSGLDWLVELREEHPETVVVAITGRGDVPTAVEAMRRGADNFLIKPVDLPSLQLYLSRGLELSALRRADRVRRRLGRPDEYFFGRSPAAERLREDLAMAAASDAPVLLTGETGTGKGVAARWIHTKGRRSQAPLVETNCSSFRGELLASELFGHARGAFTSADTSRQGLAEVADGGTLFLDEVGDMDPGVQGQFLKVIEEKTFRRLGETQLRRSDFRLIAATNHDLGLATAEGRFRRDLLYRINTFPVSLPPLREMRGDMPELLLFMLASLGRPEEALPAEVLDLCLIYPWPGNLRELRNVLERAVILSRGGALSPRHFPGLAEVPSAAGAGRSLRDLERDHLASLLRAHRGDLRSVAADLAVSRSTLYRRLKSLGIPRPSHK